ncbi:hypothetical protein Pmar_PMAR023433 [Perkinsus marinus ATCC 50983]|uniref:Uncharacterized protein n=1 Tax=Perkinsus marinus (strain ATCC 50983 / TXsc) TaxID=423536 RepID=C5KKJ5_PERM5|nr:hypothetical protein Pmar_PMAR023433 [Perkinsus marinus ATCC 50983]EER15107.1 hypothetical protein Pmar_PMAR023433 [Perkinsus marinus ATCC 50983]|eukprot:XP_002783311.1 hypothetical protein Pmar_PMAR023433 [Perkinsus marinus ATCC 50983]
MSKPAVGLQLWTMGFLVVLGATIAGTIVWLYHPAKRASVGGVIADVFVFTGELVAITNRKGDDAILRVVMKGVMHNGKAEEFARLSSESGRTEHTFAKKEGEFTWVIGAIEDARGPVGEVLMEIIKDDDVIADGRIDLNELYKEGRLSKDMQRTTEIKVPVKGGIVEDITLNGKLAKGSNFHEALRLTKSVYVGVKRAGVFGIAAGNVPLRRVHNAELSIPSGNGYTGSLGPTGRMGNTLVNL